MVKKDGLERVAIALDTDDWPTFRSWCRRFGPRVGVLKVGLEAFVAFGPPAVAEARSSGAAVFLDLKLHDIPNTVAGGVRAAITQGASWITVHAGGGRRMLEAAADAAAGEATVLAVTVLTHLEPNEVAELDWPGSLPERVASWAALARSAGCGGVVCSPRELSPLRASFPPPFRLVTPGIRPGGTATEDQRRVARPAEALADGSDLLVIGRPITRAGDPDEALDSLERELVTPDAGR